MYNVRKSEVMALKIYMIGNAHIDPVWLWQWREGYQEVMATFRSALDRMQEDPGFVFTCGCAAYYSWVEDADAELFSEIRRRVAEGRWVLAGGMWIQPDMNIPSGESLARQLLISQRWFWERFGRMAEFGYNVDSFGHNASVPMLLNAAGLTDYVWMRPGAHENGAIPEGPMQWEAPDGSCVRAYRIAGEYTGAHGMGEKIEQMAAFGGRIGAPVMCFYGVGNHGGGPTIENLCQIRAYMAAPQAGVEVCFASPRDYFAALRAERIRLPVWQGELQHHASGCYSTHSLSKRRHRQAENALVRMEIIGTMALALTGYRSDAAAASRAWQNLLFNEFHDIMGGCCLPEALDDAVMQLDEALSIADRVENAALHAISWRIDTSASRPLVRSKEEDWCLWGIGGQGTPVVVFNPHPFEARAPVVIRRPIRSARDSRGTPLPCQSIRASRTNGADAWDGLFEVRVPAWGYETCWVFLEEEDERKPEDGALRVGTDFIENAQLRAEFDPMTGGMRCLVRRDAGIDVMAAPSEARLYDTEHCDTWAHDVFRFDREAGRFDAPTFRVVETGPVRAALEIERRHGASRLVTRYILYRDADCMEVSVRLRLDERFRMVKLCWPVGGDSSVAEIPMGLLERPMTGEEEPCQRWVAVLSAQGGLAVINDGKYSYSAERGELRLTIANTSLYADHYGQAYRDADCAFMDQGEQAFRLALMPFTGELPVDALSRRASLLNRPMPWTAETYHVGALPQRYQGVEMHGSATVTALKRAEDDGGTVIRLAGTGAGGGPVSMRLPLLGRALTTNLPALGIRTLYLPDDPAQPARETLLTEMETDTPTEEENGDEHEP